MNGAQRAAALAALGKLEKRVEQLRCAPTTGGYTAITEPLRLGPAEWWPVMKFDAFSFLAGVALAALGALGAALAILVALAAH